MNTNETLIQEIIRAVEIVYIQASGPGGQNVNKVATACQLKFDIPNSSILSVEEKQRLIALSGKRVNDEGVLTLEAKRYRSQERNREDAIQRLITMIERASTPILQRKATHPTRASIEKRLSEKSKVSRQKKERNRFSDTEPD